MTLDEAIENVEKLAQLNEDQAQIYKEQGDIIGCLSYEECATEHRQLAEWLRELKALKDFANFVAESVMDEEFEENSGFYAEVFCRKLHKIGCDYKSISRKNHRKQIKDLDVVKICKQCGYHIYIEKPDIKIDITDFFDKEVNADE